LSTISNRYKAILQHLPKHVLPDQINEIQPVDEGLENIHLVLHGQKGKYLLRLYKDKHNHPNSIEEELTLIRYLGAKHYPTPRILRDGFKIEDSHAVIFEYIEGVHPVLRSEHELMMMGKLLADLHQAVANKNIRELSENSIPTTGWLSPTTPTGSGNFIPLESLKLSRQEKTTHPRNMHCIHFLLSEIRNKGTEVQYLDDESSRWLSLEPGGILSQKFQLPLPKSIIHNDFHTENIIVSVHDKKLFLIDFGDIEIDYFIQDIARAIVHLHKNTERIQWDNITAFLQGYSSERKLTAEESCYLPLLIEYNFLIYLILNLFVAFKREHRNKENIRNSISLIKEFKTIDHTNLH